MYGSTALFWVVTQRLVVISYRLFRATYRSQLQGSRVQLSSRQTACFNPTSWHHSTENISLSPTITYINSVLGKPAFGGDSWPLKMGPIGCLETSARNYHYSLCNNAEERRNNSHSGKSLRSRTFHVFPFATDWDRTIEYKVFSPLFMRERKLLFLVYLHVEYYHVIFERNCPASSIIKYKF